MPTSSITEETQEIPNKKMKVDMNFGLAVETFMQEYFSQSEAHRIRLEFEKSHANLIQQLCLEDVEEILLIAFLLGVNAQSSTTKLIFGIGPGLFGLIIVFIFCVLLCICGYSSTNRCGLLSIVIGIVIATVIFLLTVKVTSSSQQAITDQAYSNKGVTRAAIRAILIAFAIVALLTLMPDVIRLRHASRIGELRPQRARTRQF
ncbi:hypothetical protein THRCLA_22187 [Thraustotheca clavata]|uniref:Transmembrane protein n=1 Tax=Thraustotheca clavata TaxID=74557 RepID=A0A1V9ZAJ4_9STRA|nr:hypothetical protein THRCLA_22187 [Thraustotheca clavata]